MLDATARDRVLCAGDRILVRGYIADYGVIEDYGVPGAPGAP
jgi:hypothetical protein